MKNQYILQKSQNKENHYIITDTINNVVVIFEKLKFNETSKMTYLDSKMEFELMEIARINREIGEWVFENHYELVL